MDSGAIFSSCGLYRYQLWRIWDSTKPGAMCIGLNPSTANYNTDDPTIRKLVDILPYHDFGGFNMTNLYALISAKPSKLFEIPDAIKENDHHVRSVCEKSKMVIVCWGDFQSIEYRSKKILNIVTEAGHIPQCFGKNQNGTPRHPMYFVRRGIRSSDISIQNF